MTRNFESATSEAPATEQEPVWWLIEWADVGMEWTQDKELADMGRMVKAKVTPLYAQPVAVADVRGKVIESAFQFVKWAMQDGPWQGNDLDGASVQDKAEELGLLEKTKYDPVIHGESEFNCEPGDDWYVLHPAILALQQQAGRS